MTYQEYTSKRQEEFNALPIFYAFNDKQFEEGMNRFGLTVKDTDKIFRLGNTGGFYLKTDSDKIRSFFDGDTLEDLMQDKKFAEDAFYYELANHEYAINWQGDYDVCSCFGTATYGDEKSYRDYLTEMGYSEEIIEAFRKARAKYLKKYADRF